MKAFLLFFAFLFVLNGRIIAMGIFLDDELFVSQDKNQTQTKEETGTFGSLLSSGVSKLMDQRDNSQLGYLLWFLNSKFLSILDSTPTAKLFLFQKDGGVNLALWVMYHAQIVGRKNIIVIDHNSQSFLTQRLLHELEKKGVKVVRFAEPFRFKGKALTRYMGEAKHSAKLLIPMDLDEYLVLLRNETKLFQKKKKKKEGVASRSEEEGDSAAGPLPIFSTNPTSILRKLNFLVTSLPRSAQQKAFKVSQIMSVSDDCHVPPLLHPPNLLFRYADICSAVHFQPREPIHPRSKTFYWSSTFVNTDQGNHYGLTIYPCRSPNTEDCFIDSGLAFLHFHTSRFPIWLTKIVSRLNSYSFHLEEEQQCGGVGGHYCQMGKSLLHTPVEKLYEHWFDSRCHPRDDLMKFDGLYKKFCLMEKVEVQMER